VVAVAVFVAVAVTVGIAVAVFVAVAVTVGVAVAVFVAVAVTVGVAVLVGVAVNVGVTVMVGVGVFGTASLGRAPRKRTAASTGSTNRRRPSRRRAGALAL
jgi:hypothetical protein